MEKTIAINKITVTEKLFNEAAIPILKKKYNQLVLKVGCILIGLLLLISIITGIANGSPVMILGEIVIIAAVLCYIRFSLLSNERKRAYRQMAMGGTPSRETFFYSNHFNVLSDENKEDIFDYEDVLSTRQTRNLLILTLKEGKEVLLDRSGFTEGDESTVMAVFLRK